MTPDAISLVRNSWRSLDSTMLVEQFYARLFSNDTAIRNLFQGNSKALERKFNATMSEIIDHLDKPGEITARIRRLGVDHAGYGVQPRHFSLVEKALMEALARHLGDAFDKETRSAWLEAYRLIASAMQDAAMDDESPLGR